MASKLRQSFHWQMTARDVDMMAAILRCPLLAEELLKLSQTWSQPFLSLRRVQERLKQLITAGQLQAWRYATTGAGGSPLYYKLTLAGFRTVMQDDEARPPTKRFLHQINPGKHRHQRALSQFIVHTYVAAHRRGICIHDFYPENTFRIDGSRPLFPDARFTLVMPGGNELDYCIELDNSTESIWSRSDTDSISGKMQRYLVDLVASPRKYRVIFVVTGAAGRAKHIVDAARQLTLNLPFSPFYVVQLEQFISASDPFFSPCCSSPLDHLCPRRWVWG